MAVNVDSCTSNSSNCSSNKLMKTAYHDIVCLTSFYINLVVMCIIIIPLNIWDLWRIKKTNIHRRPASSNLLYFNLIFTSVIFCIGFILNSLFTLYISNIYLYYISGYMGRIGLMAQAQFHTWICVEKYLAVVHPIFYLKLKQTWYRMVWMSFTWVTSSIFGGLAVFMQQKIGIFLYITPFYGLIVLILFCSLATLATLKKPNPGEGERRKMHHQKIKAVRIITLSLVVLIFGYSPYICFTFFREQLHPEVKCIVGSIVFILLLPGTVFQSLLYISHVFKA